MNIYSRFSRLVLLLVASLTTSYALIGCSDGIQKEDPALAQKRLDSAKTIREYFDKSNGNYDSLSQEDKDAVNKVTGSEQHTKEAFGRMFGANNAGGAPGPAAHGLAPHTGPGTGN